MLVYGDHERVVDPRTEWASCIARGQALHGGKAGIERHQRLVRLFVAMSGVVQGLADAAFAATGADAHGPLAAAGLDALRATARAIERSWSSGHADQPCPALPTLDAYALPDRVTIRRCEGYAYYALYPELYLAAAAALPKGAVVIGLRSIGTGLAALAATVCDAAFVCTVRPLGDVFARTLAIDPALAATLTALRDRPFVLVDEGPGLSGSSLGGAADWLARIGVTDIRFLPSHDGPLGPQASPAHRTRWDGADRPVARFEDVVLPRLSGWFADVTGARPAPLRDVSGGGWRAPGSDAPVDPNREARKYRLTTARGDYLLKFVGLDDEAAAKFDRARALHAAGFAAEPLAVRHGFLLERWIDGAAPAGDAAIIAALPAYLAFRAAAFPASAGASLTALVAMARYNLADVAGIGALLDGVDPAALQHHVRAVHGDARLHRWEWITGPDGLRKTDAIDHSQAHDLVGPQDIAWDLAGAIAEYPSLDRAALIAAVMPDRPEAEALVACLLPCYLGFQRGWWRYAPDAAAQSDSYAAKAAALVAG